MAALVSICVPLYNAETYIEATIESVLAQTFTDWELILADDCSNDRTVAIVQALVAQLPDRPIRFIQNPVRLGMADNWNRVTELAEGEFIKLMGQDDLLEADCIARQVDAARTHPVVTVVTGSRRFVTATGNPVMVRNCFPGEGVYGGMETIRRCLRTGTNIIGEPVTVLFRAATLGRHQLFEPSIVYATEVDLWLRLLTRGDLYFIATPKTKFRIHDRSATKSLGPEAVRDFMRVVDRMIEKGYFQCSPLCRQWLTLKAHALTLVRRLIYRFLARN